jgi:hypothetical protein
MTDRSDEFRKAAAECLQLARATSDPSTRVSLLAMAQKWLDLANGPRGQDDLDAAVRESSMKVRCDRGRRKRPRGGRPPEKSDELASVHSITSSARASSVGGTVMPRVLAAVRFMASLNVVGCWTGKSAGFSPFNTRPV